MSGPATGPMYALVALSLVIVYNATRAVNFALTATPISIVSRWNALFRFETKPPSASNEITVISRARELTV